MRNRILLLVLALSVAVCSACPAGAEVFLNREKPADWEERDLLVITVMDFMQNDAFVLQCGGASMLIDGGTGKHWEKLITWLEDHGLSHVNILFNTHPHDDHLGAQIKMLQSGRLTADQFITPFSETYGAKSNSEKVKYQQQMVKLLQEKEIPFRQIMPDEELRLGQSTLTGYRITTETGEAQQEAVMVLYRWPDGKDANQTSGVLWLHYGDAAILLAADLTGGGERWMAEHYGAEGLKSDILKAPHHGIVIMVSEFLQAVDPALTIVTNTQKAKAKAQLDARGYANITNSAGMITLETDGTDWYVTQEK